MPRVVGLRCVQVMDVLVQRARHRLSSTDRQLGGIRLVKAAMQHVIVQRSALDAKDVDDVRIMLVDPHQRDGAAEQIGHRRIGTFAVGLDDLHHVEVGVVEAQFASVQAVAVPPPTPVRVGCALDRIFRLTFAPLDAALEVGRIAARLIAAVDDDCVVTGR